MKKDFRGFPKFIGKTQSFFLFFELLSDKYLDIIQHLRTVKKSPEVMRSIVDLDRIIFVLSTGENAHARLMYEAVWAGAFR